VAAALRSWWTPEAGARKSRSIAWAVVGLGAGFVGLCVLAAVAGMAVWLAALYFVILLLVALVYARLRSETGVALVWAFPYGLQQRGIRYFLGSRRVAGLGLRSDTIFTMATFLSRGYFPTVAGYHVEGLQLARETKITPGSMAGMLLAAIGLGAILSFLFHLPPYYGRGALGLRGGLWGAYEAQTQYAAILRSAQFPTAPEPPRIIATLSGAGLLGVLTAVRTRWLSFPLHPLGYAMATAYGSLIWAPFFIVWLVKSLILRYAGSKAYLRALPGFLGFALGHFVIAGGIWGSLGAALGGVFLRYGVWFG